MYIKFLPSAIINQIAAGEIVESYADIVKELVENAIDAQASQIDISVNFPITSIIVKDNGFGMTLDNLQRSILRHTTSKLDDNDLTKIKTLGFRGEALSAIAAVSFINIRTNVQNGKICELEAITGHVKYAKEFACTSSASSTVISIQNIFFNTPVRLKFLKSDEKEYNNIIRFIKIISLSHDINIRLYKNDNLIFQNENMNILNILGKSWNQAKYYNLSNGEWKISGYACNINFLHYDTSHQYFFVNNRYIEDRKLSNILRSIYNTPSGKYPCIIAKFQIPYDWIDVNIHPKKTEVRLRDLNKVCSLLKEAILGAITNVSKFQKINITNINSKTQISSWNELNDHIYNINFDIINNDKYMIFKFNEILYLVRKYIAYKIYISISNNNLHDINNKINIVTFFSYKETLKKLGIIISYEKNYIILHSILNIYRLDKIKYALCTIHHSKHSEEMINEIILSLIELDSKELISCIIQNNYHHIICTILDNQSLESIYNSSLTLSEI